ncbi:MAG: TRAP transporter small permease [Candidatus Accumulibacter sp.]|jgi:TRAP-type C4-dicarboxylate transport system permease small subunit|nr:TRAP transporter small permease [Accumulibacter sp.]
MQAILDKAAALYRFVLGSVLGLMVIIVFVNVILRKFFHSGIDFTEEGLRYLFIWMSYLGIVAAFKTNSHIRMTMLTDRLPERWRVVLAFVMNFAILYALYFCAHGGMVYIDVNFGTRGELIKIPYWTIIFSVVFACVCMAVMTVIEMFGQVKYLLGRKEQP